VVFVPIKDRCCLQAVERQLSAFREKFGRDPNDDDPIFFDPDADDPVPLSDKKYERMMIDAMAEVGISQAMIFALKRTGRIVTERNNVASLNTKIRRDRPARN